MSPAVKHTCHCRYLVEQTGHGRQASAPRKEMRGRLEYTDAGHLASTTRRRGGRHADLATMLAGAIAEQTGRSKLPRVHLRLRGDHESLAAPAGDLRRGQDAAGGKG